MTTNPSRRAMLASSIAVAAGAALPSLGHVSSAMADSSFISAAEIIAAIRDKKITATDVAKAAIARAEIDSWSRPGPLPLAGLPIVVKDNINTADMPTSGGTPALRNAQPLANAPSLQKLLRAGVIVIGKANTNELSFSIPKTNPWSFAGQVKNPYDKTRIPGGSSGGTAAAIPAGLV